jgi:Family of unknown function (DUF5684)
MFYGGLPALMDSAAVMQQRAGDSGVNPIVMIVYLAILVAMFASMWKVFAKAGQPGWAAIVPIYNVIVLLRIVGRPWWWILLLLVPIVSLVILIMVYNDVSKSFGHGVGFTIGLILLPFIFWPILGFGSSQYRGPAASSMPVAQPA